MQNELRRVKFFSINDLSIGFYLDRIEKVFDEFGYNHDTIDINQVIELYNIQLFLKNGVYSIGWSKEVIENYKGIANQFDGLIGNYFSQIDSKNIEHVIKLLTLNYKNDFWTLFEKYKTYERISLSIFQILLDNDYINIYAILTCKTLTKHYGKVIRDYFFNKMQSIEIIFDKYIVKQVNNSRKYYLPEELSNEDKIELLNLYIEWPDANSNYLKLISESKGNKEFPITDKIRLKAKRQFDTVMGKLFEGGVSFKSGVSVSFLSNTNYEVQLNYENNILKATYSKDWIEQNLDYPTILNNFIYIFQFVDQQFRCQQVCNKTSLGTVEQTLGVRGKNEYQTGIVFGQMQALADLQMHGYYNILLKNEIAIENVIKWFFEDYLKEEFGISFSFNVPSEKSTYLEKYRAIAPEMDSILKQYKIWCEENEIDKELFQNSTAHILVKDIPSKLEEKYIYAHGNKCENLMHYCFLINQIYTIFLNLKISIEAFLN